MRGSKAKKLRAQAKGVPGPKAFYYSGSPRVLHENCWRADYKRLKALR